LKAIDNTRVSYRAAVDDQLDAHRSAVAAAWSSYLEAADSESNTKA